MMKRLSVLALCSALASNCSESTPVSPSPVSAPPAGPTQTIVGFIGLTADIAHCLASPDQPGCTPAERTTAQVAGGVPDAPGNLVATVSGASVALSWSAPPAADATVSYLIEAGSVPGSANLVSFQTGSTLTSFAASGVGPGTYYVRVRATNALGTGSPSNEATVIVGGGCSVPGPPGALTILTNSGGAVTLSWQAPAGVPTTYVIEAGSAPGLANLTTSTIGNVTTLSISGVSPGTYYVRVRARNACGAGAASNEIVLAVGPGGPPTTTTQSFAVNCTSAGQLCSPAYTTSITAPQRSNLQVEYVTAATHCASGRYSFFVDGILRITTPILGFPSVRSGPLDLGTVAPGTHTLAAQTEGVLGGCNFGRVESWGGTLIITLQPL